MLTGRARRGLVEAAVLYAVYLVYRSARAHLRATPHAALHNARQVIGMERTVHLFHEARVQGWFLHWSPIVRAWDVYYGGLHFAVPIIAFVVLWRRDRARYLFFRNVFGWMLLLGLVGFAVYPVTPPRLLAPSYRFVDTGRAVGGIGAVGGAEGNGGGNPYAAMPSLHLGWSTWCVVALLPVVRRRWLRVALVLHPLLMLTAVVVTANHYILDGVGGVLAFAGAFALAAAASRIATRLRSP